MRLVQYQAPCAVKAVARDDTQHSFSPVFPHFLGLCSPRRAHASTNARLILSSAAANRAAPDGGASELPDSPLSTPCTLMCFDCHALLGDDNCFRRHVHQHSSVEPRVPFSAPRWLGGHVQSLLPKLDDRGVVSRSTQSPERRLPVAAKVTPVHQVRSKLHQPALYHPGQNKYSNKYELKSKTIDPHQITNIMDLY